MDEQVARRDPAIADVLGKFVTVRVIQAHGLDLSLFQFDGELTWAVFFLNADRTVYGRYGTRSDREAVRDISLDGFRKAAEGALELHAKFPAVKPSLAKKTGPAPTWPTPEKIPALPPKRAVRADGSRGACIHCHDVSTFELLSKRRAGTPITDRDFWPYPKPDVLGLQLDPNERATVEAIAPDSPAAKAGFQKGDAITMIAGQPPLSTADVQWVLHHAPDKGELPVAVTRGGAAKELTLPLPAGWRRGSDVEWRTVMWPVGFQIVGFRSKPARADGRPALAVRELSPNFLQERNEGPRKAGLQKEDVIVSVDGQTAPLANEGAFLGYVMQKKKPGETLTLGVRRNGEVKEVAFPVK